MQAGRNQTGSLSIHLLNDVTGRVIQTWKFDDCARVTVGRGEENQITLSDQQVSRLHLELILEHGEWHLISHGRNGTRMNGKSVEKAVLANGAVFQLGSNGPSFRFDTLDFASLFTGTITSQNDIGDIDHLFIDEARKTEEVNQIVEGEGFRALQEQARKLRQKRLEK